MALAAALHQIQYRAQVFFVTAWSDTQHWRMLHPWTSHVSYLSCPYIAGCLALSFMNDSSVLQPWNGSVLLKSVQCRTCRTVISIVVLGLQPRWGSGLGHRRRPSSWFPWIKGCADLSFWRYAWAFCLQTARVLAVIEASSRFLYIIQGLHLSLMPVWLSHQPLLASGLGILRSTGCPSPHYRVCEVLHFSQQYTVISCMSKDFLVPRVSRTMRSHLLLHCMCVVPVVLWDCAFLYQEKESQLLYNILRSRCLDLIFLHSTTRSNNLSYGLKGPKESFEMQAYTLVYWMEYCMVQMYTCEINGFNVCRSDVHKSCRVNNMHILNLP